MKTKSINIVQRFSKLILDVRSGQIPMSSIDKELQDDEHIKMKDLSRNLTHNLEVLKEKGHFIRDFDRQHFRYVNVTDYYLDPADNERTIETKLITNDQYDRVLCSTDLLNKKNPDQLKKLRQNLVKELKNTPNLRLIYADFSYCSYELHHIMRLPLLKQNKTSSSREIQTSPSMLAKAKTIISPSEKAHTAISSPAKLQTNIPPYTRPETYVAPSTIISSSKEMQTNVSLLTNAQTYMTPPLETHHFLATSTSLLDNETINILLLGETGVGKSTFINAFANYLTFNTLNEAQSNKPMVLIPVSFLLTVGDNFEEHVVKFGDADPANNEDFDHPGQSVTQHCRSYTFNINHNNGKQLCIIDTPGFGDTRGIDQDDRNMQHILEYIQTFSHINAVCFLLKPNESRLNIFFRSCLTQLFSLLGPTIADNIIFCFTNSRSTFYTPGNTAPLLKQMLASLSMDKVPFKKENTFCFDSESFRYLVARQNHIPFTDDDKQEYKMSWINSVTEVNRFIRYIRNNLSAYRR
jgi:GTP-binding protein EngB required for normal cell division